MLDLSAKRALSETSAIRARADIAKTRADITRAEAEAQRARIRLGEPGDDNPQVRQAMAALDQARLDLLHSAVVAPADGVVTNLRLAPGQFANRGQPVLSFMAAGPRWVTAAMRENQLGNIAPGNRAYVVFDDHPGGCSRRAWKASAGASRRAARRRTDSCPRSTRPPAGCASRSVSRCASCWILPTTPRTRLPPGRSGAQANVVVLTRERSGDESAGAPVDPRSSRC